MEVGANQPISEHLMGCSDERLNPALHFGLCLT
jgi:hypothetical protein